MSQSTQLPWRRRCTLDLLFHSKGRPGVILGSPIELCIHCARCYVSDLICTVTDGGSCWLSSHGVTACSLDRRQDKTLLLSRKGYVMELLLLWMILILLLCMIALGTGLVGLWPLATRVGELDAPFVLRCTAELPSPLSSFP